MGLFEVFPDNPNDQSADGVQKLRASLNRVLESRVPDKMEVQKYDIRRPNSEGNGFEVRYWDPINTPILGDSSEVKIIIHQVVDVTALVQANQHRERSEANVLELRSEMGLREQFVSLLSHDLKNPLFAAKTSAQMLLRSAGDSSRVPLLAGRIIDSIGRAEQMISNLLDANRIKAGKPLMPELTEVSLHSLLQNALQELSAVHGDRFVLNSEPGEMGHWDKDYIRRIVENLCVNAVKYGFPESAITVSVASTSDQVKISVHNKGEAIGEDELHGLFDQFKRGRSAVSGKRGWGLGLTLVKGFAEAHGGYVEVKSSEDSGTTFSIILPRDSRSSLSLGAVK